MEQYRRLLKRAPGDLGAKMGLAWALLSLREYDECEELMNEVIAGGTDAPRAHLIKAIVAFHRGQVDASLALLKAVEVHDSRLRGLHRQLGMAYLRRNRPPDAEAAFKKALEIDPDDADSHDGLGVVYRKLGRPAEAVHEHMQSVALQHYRPETHLHLGMALAESGQIEWAIRAFEVSLEMDPANAVAHLRLARIYGHAKGDQRRAGQHAEQARRLRRPVE